MHRSLPFSPAADDHNKTGRPVSPLRPVEFHATTIVGSGRLLGAAPPNLHGCNHRHGRLISSDCPTWQRRRCSFHWTKRPNHATLDVGAGCMYETIPLVTEDQMTKVIQYLVSQGVTLDEVPLVLCKLVPFDADLLADLLNRFAKAE
jgi:hypothetical protein